MSTVFTRNIKLLENNQLKYQDEYHFILLQYDDNSRKTITADSVKNIGDFKRIRIKVINKDITTISVKRNEDYEELLNGNFSKINIESEVNVHKSVWINKTENSNKWEKKFESNITNLEIQIKKDHNGDETKPFIIAFSADTDYGKRKKADPDTVYKCIEEEKPDRYIFGGDGPYTEEEGETKLWTQLIDKYGLKPIIKVCAGNHDNDESESEITEKVIEEWMPSLKETPEVSTSSQAEKEEWEKTKWIHSWQDKNSFFICMNSSDSDREFSGRNQYNWIVKQIEQAKQLKEQGKIDWIFVIIHKPFYALKAKKNTPYRKMREIYQPLFDKLQVDFMLYGHSHNVQIWLPMIFEAKQEFVKLDETTYDFSKPHGQFHILCGAGGHEINKFKEDTTKNTNILFANDKTFAYTMFYINGKQCIIQIKDTTRKELYKFKVIKDTSIA